MSKIKYIETYSDFILNETLKTHDIDLTLHNINRELSLLRYDFLVWKEYDKIVIKLNNLSTNHIIGIQMDNLNSLITNRHGWFPSEMKVFNLSKMVNIKQYDEKELIDNSQYYDSVEITYEPKYDIEYKIPNLLFHLSIQEYENEVLKKGLIPKSKSKLSKHLDRIYLCDNKRDCENLKGRMKLYYVGKKSKNRKNKINDKWIIYEIDSSELNIKLYKDPNSNGYYCIDNIPANKIRIIDKE